MSDLPAPLTREQIAALVEPDGIAVDLLDEQTVRLRIGAHHMVLDADSPSWKDQLDIMRKILSAAEYARWLLAAPERRRSDPSAAPWSPRAQATRESLRGGT